MLTIYLKQMKTMMLPAFILCEYENLDIVVIFIPLIAIRQRIMI